MYVSLCGIVLLFTPQVGHLLSFLCIIYKYGTVVELSSSKHMVILWHKIILYN